MKGFKSQDLAVFLDVNFKGFTPPADSKPIPEATFTDKPFAEFRGDLGSEEGQERTPGRVVFLANRPTSPSLDGPDHGIFATALLDALKGGADTDGKEADGLVTVDELAEYLDKQIPELARKYGKTDKDKEQVAIVLGSPNTHFVLSHDAEPYKKAQERLAKFEQLVKDGKITDKAVQEEGRQFLGRMPQAGGAARTAQGLPETGRRRHDAGRLRRRPATRSSKGPSWAPPWPRSSPPR